MRNERRQKIELLLEHLERLEAEEPRPEQAAIGEIARRAIIEELSKLAKDDWLAVYKSGDNLDAVSLAG